MPIRQKSMLTMVVAFISLAISGAGYAATNYYVWRDNPSPELPFTNWAMAATNIQVAVDCTIDDDTVYVTNGTYDTGGAVTPGYALTNRVYIAKRITLTSMNGPESTIIQGTPASDGYCGDDAVRCVYLTNTPTLIGFTLTNGYTMTNGNNTFDRCGGGLFYNANSIASNCVLTMNVAHHKGGGVYMNSANLNTQGLINCTISGNTCTNIFTETSGSWISPEAGGVYMKGGMLTNCILTMNKCKSVYPYGSGGGAYVIANGVINNCTFTLNEVHQQSGGVGLGSASHDDATVANCTFISNSAPGGGGGAMVMGRNASLRNCLVMRTVDGSGVALYQGGTMINCTAVSNQGWGVQVLSWTPTYNPSHLVNSIVRDNVWGNIYNNTNSTIGTGIVVRCTCTTPDGSGINNITNNPQFVNAGAWNYRLQRGSPCINAGTNEAWMNTATDLDGHSRICPVMGTNVDMGAYEYFVNRGTIFMGF